MPTVVGANHHSHKIATTTTTGLTLTHTQDKALQWFPTLNFMSCSHHYCKLGHIPVELQESYLKLIQMLSPGNRSGHCIGDQLSSY